MTLKNGMQHWVLKYYQVWLMMTLGFMARSNLVHCAFVCEKGKTMDFSETIVVYDIKSGRCSQHMVKTFKNILFWNQKADDLETWYAALVS